MQSDQPNQSDLSVAEGKLPEPEELAAYGRQLSKDYPNVAFVVIAASMDACIHTTNVADDRQVQDILSLTKKALKEGSVERDVTALQ